MAINRKTNIFLAIAMLLLFISIMGAINNRHFFGNTEFSIAQKEYINLFPTNTRPKLNGGLTANNKGRKPISEFYYGEGGNDFEYCIIVSKVPANQSSLDLNNIVSKYGETGKSNPTSYVTFTERFDLLYSQDSIPPATKIILSWTNDSVVTVIKNDSVACYWFKLNEFGIRYNENDFFDVYLKTLNDKFAHLALELMFIKKGNTVYWAIMYATDYLKPVRPGVLYKLFCQRE